MAELQHTGTSIVRIITAHHERVASPIICRIIHCGVLEPTITDIRVRVPQLRDVSRDLGVKQVIDTVRLNSCASAPSNHDFARTSPGSCSTLDFVRSTAVLRKRTHSPLLLYVSLASTVQTLDLVSTNCSAACPSQTESWQRSYGPS